MGCAFCAEWFDEEKRDLTSGEMVAQVMYVQRNWIRIICDFHISLLWGLESHLITMTML